MQLAISSGKTNPPQKYIDNRSMFKNGDLVVYRGSSFMSKAIQYFDKAYYNHIGVVWTPEKSDRLLTLDMWSDGLACIPLSRRMSGYDDFCILRPKTTESNIEDSIKKILSYWDGTNVGYDYGLLLRFVIVKKTGIDLTGLSKKKNFICSEFAQYYTNLLGFKTYDEVDMITPQDFMRYIDENFEILLK